MNVFQVQLPKQDNDGNPVDAWAIAKEIALRVGGATITEAVGLWYDDSGRCYQDAVLNVQAYCDDAGLADLQSRVQSWAQVLKQECLVTAAWRAGVEFVNA